MRGGLLLLGALVVLHFLGPAVQLFEATVLKWALLPAYALVLGAAVVAVREGQRSRVLMVGLASPMVAAGVWALWGGEPMLVAAGSVPFIAFAAWLVLRGVLRRGFITEVKLIGSASVFLLLAHAWAGVYAGIEVLAPGSFAGENGGEASVTDLAYFSFVSQTTLGYGDVTPRSSLARAAATFQAVMGLFYMGVVVARFAGQLDLSDGEAVGETDGGGERGG